MQLIERTNQRGASRGTSSAIHAERPIARQHTFQLTIGDGCALQFEFLCPKRWDGLAPTGTDRVRHCAQCSKSVYFCASIDEARERGRRHECIAIDAALVRGDALTAHRAPTPPRTIPPTPREPTPPPTGAS